MKSSSCGWHSFRSRFVSSGLCGLLLIQMNSFSEAQSTRPPSSAGSGLKGPALKSAPDEEPSEFTIEIDILIQSQPSYRVRSQEWGRAFQEIGYFPRFREPRPGEKLRVFDDKERTTPTVHVVGGMSQDGVIEIQGRQFEQTDLKELQAVLQLIEKFGESGPPDKNPRWGFTDEQLQDISEQLSEPVSGPVELQSPIATVESLHLPPAFRLNFTAASRERALGKRPESAPESIDLTGVAKGTSLAIVLSQYGLGFRPKKSGANQIVLEIDAGNESSNLWPAGWKSQETVSAVLPTYLKSIEIKVEDYPVNGLLDVVAEKLGVAVYLSSFELAAAGRDLEELKYSRSDKMPPGKLLTLLGDRYDLGFDVRVDEAGKVFLWTTTAEESKAFRARFAHIQQK
jgi:hypothetical protein